MIYQDRI